MGAMQNNEPKTGKRSKSRGSVRNADRLAAFGSGKKAGTADWGNCDSERLQAAVVAITSMGGAVTFGLSRDKGAHSLTLMLDDDRKTMWYNGADDLDEKLEAVKATLDALA